MSKETEIPMRTDEVAFTIPGTAEIVSSADISGEARAGSGSPISFGNDREVQE